MEFLGFILTDLIFAAIGWLCLFVWYRDREKIRKIRDQKYAGLYGGAGRVFILNLIAGVGAIAMIGMVILVIIDAIYRAIVD